MLFKRFKSIHILLYYFILVVTYICHNLTGEADDGFDRRALSYWFHIICNSLHLPSRPFSSPRRFMRLHPFLIRVTDRRSAKKDAENERERGDFVTGVFVFIWMITVGWVWTSSDIFPTDWKPLPAPTFFLLHLPRPGRCVIPSVPNSHTC